MLIDNGRAVEDGGLMRGGIGMDRPPFFTYINVESYSDCGTGFVDFFFYPFRTS